MGQMVGVFLSVVCVLATSVSSVTASSLPFVYSSPGRRDVRIDYAYFSWFPGLGGYFILAEKVSGVWQVKNISRRPITKRENEQQEILFLNQAKTELLPYFEEVSGGSDRDKVFSCESPWWTGKYTPCNSALTREFTVSDPRYAALLHKVLDPQAVIALIEQSNMLAKVDAMAAMEDTSKEKDTSRRTFASEAQFLAAIENEQMPHFEPVGAITDSVPIALNLKTLTDGVRGELMAKLDQIAVSRNANILFITKIAETKENVAIFFEGRLRGWALLYKWTEATPAVIMRDLTNYSHSDAFVTASAIHYAAIQKNRDSISPLLDIVKNSPNLNNAQRAADTIRAFNDPGLTADMVKILKFHNTPEKRKIAADYLAKVGDLRPIEDALNSESDASNREFYKDLLLRQPSSGSRSDAPVMTTSGKKSAVERMKELNKMYEDGLISEPEYKAKRKQLLDEL